MHAFSHLLAYAMWYNILAVIFNSEPREQSSASLVPVVILVFTLFQLLNWFTILISRCHSPPYLNPVVVICGRCSCNRSHDFSPQFCTGQLWSQGLTHLDFGSLEGLVQVFARGIAKRTTSNDTTTQHHYYQAYKIPSLSLSQRWQLACLLFFSLTTTSNLNPFRCICQPYGIHKSQPACHNSHGYSMFWRA